MVISESTSRASSFGAEAERYDRARPQYPAAVVTALTGGEHLRVLDVGCGTGIAARAFQDQGCTLTGVEHDPRMAAVARRHGVPVDVGGFEDWTPPADLFDLVISGQAWHWIDRVRGPLKAADALRPGGCLAVFWIEYGHQPEVAEAFSVSYGLTVPSLLETSHPLGRLGADAGRALARQYASDISESGRFDQASVRAYVDQRAYSTDQWIDELPTHSDHRILPEEQRRQLLASVRSAIDGLGGQFSVKLTTHVVRARTLT